MYNEIFLCESEKAEDEKEFHIVVIQNTCLQEQDKTLPARSKKRCWEEDEEEEEKESLLYNTKNHPAVGAENMVDNKILLDEPEETECFLLEDYYTEEEKSLPEKV